MYNHYNCEQVRTLLSLHRTPHLSSRALYRLIKATDTPEAITKLSPAELYSLKISPDAQLALRAGCDQRAVDQDMATIAALGIQLLSLNSEDYPELLKEISNPPPLLYVRGNASLLNQPQLGMVGSRRTSRQGSDNAYRFSYEFAQAGFTISSGLALGIDAECHRGALAAKGKTVAVLGTGVDIVYPVRNRLLFEEMVHTDRAVVISEFPLGTRPQPSLFPQRNRIISGISLGVLVVEAALKSGSLITARYAMEQGREVFAIPGSIFNKGSKGTNNLIKQGATLVSTAADIMEEFQGWLPKIDRDPEPRVTEIQHSELNIAEQQLLTLLGFDPVSIDMLQLQIDWPMAQLSAALTTLELKGQVENIGGCYQRIVKAS